MAEWNTRANDLFLRAVEVEPPEERRRLLDQECGDDASLRAQVESLLAASARADSFLNRPAVAVSAARGETVDYDPIIEGPGTVIGPYKLMEQIGEGGMGRVFVAEQQRPVRRKVALKIIKPGMDTRDVIARFEAERQALALMDHPNIAHVLDAGATDSGRPYFVMELVRGVPIIEYCDQQQLTTGERLELFLAVCQAVQHAHQKGIIHRDLKPSNILVAPHDGVPVIKVIDFGIAKAIGQQLTDKTIYTRFAQILGTPLYMSPEQAEINALDVDIRSDVYSLGVLLYELLTGTTPFDRQRFAAAAYEEIRRILKEEEPPRPSNRLSTLGDTLSRVSAQRKTEPAKLSALVRGDLDWIVMKALEKDRNRRYETASAFAQDVRRFLNVEPIEARPPSLGYRFVKLARRNKVALTTAALVAAALVLGTVVSVWQAVRATAARGVAQAAERTAVDERDRAREANVRLQAAREELQQSLYVSDMNLCKMLLDARATQAMQAQLNRHRPGPDRPDLRGFEWWHLARASHSAVRTLTAHAGSVLHVEYSRDGKRLVSAGRPGGVWLWDAKTGEKLRELAGHTEPVWCATFSRDGTQVASASADRTVRVWDAASGKVRRTLTGHTDQVYVVCFDAEGRRLVTGSQDGTVRLWDVATGKELRSHPHPKAVPAVAISPDGKVLATAGGDPTIRLWDLETGHELRALKEHTAVVRSLAFSPDGQHLASASWDGRVLVWDGKAGTIAATIRHAGRVETVAFSPDGTLVAGAGWAQVVRLRHWAANQAAGVMSQHVSHIATVAFSPDGQTVASGGEDGTIKLWRYRQSEPAFHVWPEDRGQRHQGSVAGLAMSRDGCCLATVGSDGEAKLWDARTGALLRSWKTDNRSLTQSVTLDAIGRRLAATCPGGTVRIWGIADGAADRLIQLPEGEEAVSVTFHPAEPDCLAVASNTGGVALWDLATGKARQPLTSGKAMMRQLVFSPDGERLIGASLAGEGVVWDTRTGAVVRRLVGHTATVLCVACSPDGQIIATGSGDRSIRLYNARTGEFLRALEGHGGRIFHLAFSPDGRRLASVSQDLRLKLWAPATGANLLTLFAMTDSQFQGLWAVAFRPDGGHLYAGCGDGAIRVWDGRPMETSAGGE